MWLAGGAAGGLIVKKGPNKGFIKELSRSQTQRHVETKKLFTYSKPVTPESKITNSMHTPHRIREFKSVPESKANIVGEHNMHVKKRRGDI